MTQNNVYCHPLVTSFHLIPIMAMFRSKKMASSLASIFGLHELTNTPDLWGARKWPLTMFIDIDMSHVTAERRKNYLHFGLRSGRQFGLHDFTNAPDLWGAQKWPLTMFIDIALSQAFI